MDSAVKDLKISKEIPSFLNDMNLEPGVYSYGVASNENVDSEGDKVIIADDVLKGLESPPYNKIFLSHDNEDIASGVIKFAGRVPEVFGKDAIIVERINEHHPKFDNIVGSISNGNLDSYTVGGSSTVEFAIDPETNKSIRVRNVEELSEVSRTSFPAHPEASIKGMFFIKNKKGGLFVQEEKIMEAEKLDSTLADIQKALDSNAEALKKTNERLDVFEAFKKSLEDKSEEEGEEKTEEDKGEEKTEEKTEDKAEDTEEGKDGTKEELTKVKKELSDLKKTLPQSKRAVKDNTDAEKLEKTKKKLAPMMGFLKSSETDFGKFEGGK